MLRLRIQTLLLASLLQLAVVPHLLARSKNKNPDQPADTILKSQTELVLVPVVVTGKADAHITGLKQEDFRVLENGSERPITTFQEVVSDASLWKRGTGPSEFSNITPSGGSEGRITIIVLDFVNTDFATQVYANHQLLRYLRASTDQREPTALLALTRSGLQAIHDFTVDPRVLSAALRKVSGEPSRGDDSQQVGSSGGEPLDVAKVNSEASRLEMLAQKSETTMAEIDQAVAVTDTLKGLQQIAQAFRGIPVRKSLIWITGGFPFQINPDTVTPLPGNYVLSDFDSEYELTWQKLNDAQISLYPVDANGLEGIATAETGGVDSTSAQMQLRPDQFAKNLSSYKAMSLGDNLVTFTTFASMTGGRAFVNRNDLDQGIREAANDSSQYYMLGYYLDRSKAKPGWNRLAVKVEGQHVNVRARSGFFVSKQASDPNTAKQHDVTLALQSPLEYTALHLVARWGDAQPGKESGKKRVVYSVHVEPDPILLSGSDNNHLRVELIAQARTPKGAAVGDILVRKIDGHATSEHMALYREKGFEAVGGIELAPGEYTVRFVICDDLSGRLGSVDAPINVE